MLSCLAPRPLRSGSAFTLVELLVSLGIVSTILLLLANATGTVATIWSQGERRVQTIQNARGALEMITREMTPAIVDTRMQYIILPGDELEDAGATQVPPQSPAALWMAPMGDQGDLRCLGIYLYRDDLNRRYQLKRLYIPPNHPSGYFPKFANRNDVTDTELRTSPLDASWFTRHWNEDAFNEEDINNKDVVVSTLADHVVALWLQPIDQLGNAIPWVSRSNHHPTTTLIYNSAAYFVTASSAPFSDGSSTRYMAHSDRVMRANRIPAALDITVITVDQTAIDSGLDIPAQINVFADDALNLAASIKAFQQQLSDNGIHTARAFSTRVKLLNGG